MAGITLDARLSAIAEMVGRTDTYADIGCDHGRLGAFLLQKNWVGCAHFADISEGSLEKARRLCRLIGVEDRASFHVSDGLDWIGSPVGTIVIAGMGGDTIEGILTRGQDKLMGTRLLLQANVGKPSLRWFLTGHHYRLTDERLVVERGRCYVIMEAVPGEQTLSEEEAVIGPVLLRERPKELAALKAFRLRVANKALTGAERSGRMEEIEPIRREIALWEALRLE